MDYTNKTWGIGIVVASFLPNIPLFQHSIIPSIIPYEWHKLAATKSSVLSVACRISETFTNDPS